VETMSAMMICTVCASGRPPLFPDALVYLVEGGGSANATSVPYSCRELQAILELRNVTSASGETTTSSTTCASLQRLARSTCGCVSCTNVYQDACPLQADNKCGNYDPLLDPSQLCLNVNDNDCVDCDPYREAFRNCQECTEAGGAWCPGDALCAFAPLPNWLPGFVKYGSCDELSWLTASEQCDPNTTTTSTPDGVYHDPLVAANAWAYDMIRVNRVWEQRITGRGVRIRINDDGVDAFHSEFQGRFDWNASCEHSQAYTPTSSSDTATARSNGSTTMNPSFAAQPIRDTHGTSCASIAAGSGNNGACAVGIAPGSILSSCKILSDDGDLVSDYPQSLSRYVSKHDISSNSFGYTGCHSSSAIGRRQRRHTLQRDSGRQLQSDSNDTEVDACPFAPDSIPCQECNDFSGDLSDACAAAIAQYCSNSIMYDSDPACVEHLELFASCEFNSLTGPEQEQLARGIRLGRNGLGILFVFPSGNDRNYGNYASYTAFGNSRFVMSVGAVNRWGYPASYSSPGAGVFVSAPGGDADSRSNWITALAAVGDTESCHDAGYGTSFATPVVAGVLALVLEVNPTLSWRDAQGLLAVTSRKIQPLADDGDSQTADSDDWAMNGAGLWHSYRYGFGVADADAAVDRARRWRNYGKERFVAVESGRNLSIPIVDSATSTVVSSVRVETNLTVESVVAYLNLVDSSRGHLRITLVSPSGTESVLTPGQRPENQQVGHERWKLMTVRSWGEGSMGNWTLFVTDIEAGDVSSCSDLPLNFEGADGNADHLTCSDVQESSGMETYCQNVDIAISCCSCGGGQNSTVVKSMLHSWMLMVYGHDPSDLRPTPSSTSDATSLLPTATIFLVVSFIIASW
jgi:subtilisin family serine protease